MTDRTESVAVLVDDMFFSVKIHSAVSAHGRSYNSIKSNEQLQYLAANPPALIIVDLNSERVNPLEAIQFLKSSDQLKSIPIVGFVSHIRTELIRDAQAAGCDYVLPRSAFTQMLGDIVTGKLGKERIED